MQTAFWTMMWGNKAQKEERWIYSTRVFEIGREHYAEAVSYFKTGNQYDLGKKRSDEFKQAMTGTNNHFFSKNHSDETKQKMHKPHNVTIRPVNHGTTTMYRRGCRCASCCEVMREYDRKRYAENPARRQQTLARARVQWANMKLKATANKAA